MIHKHTRVFLTLVLSLLIGTLSAQAQTACKGVVKDASGQGIPAVNITVKGSTTGTVTDISGSFTINAQKGDILVFSMIGFLTEEVPVDDRESYNIMLIEDIKELGEVVVVGYGTAKKSDLTGSVSSVKSEELVRVATPNVAQAMQGRASGVMIVAESGEPGAGMKVRVRGTGTINNSNPLYVVDGFPTGSIDYLSPNDIESIDILKDASATAIYGNRGANGVVLITTKKVKKLKP
jgi:TonB-dependent SusC/RagA subfamily outer membrane receptor